MLIVSAARLFVALALNLPVTFHRQKVFGQYIFDFYCASAGIAIEVDGSQYFSEEGEQKDGLRDCYCAICKDLTSPNPMLKTPAAPLHQILLRKF